MNCKGAASASGGGLTAQSPNDFGIVVGAENGRTSDQGIGPRGNNIRRVAGLDPAVHLQANFQLGFIDDAAGLLELGQGRGDELLTAEARVDRHQQHQVDLVDDPVEHIQRRGRVEYDTGLAAALADQAQGPVQVTGGFRMDADQACAGFGKIGDDAVDRLDHQVDIDWCGNAVIAQGLAYQRPDGQIGDVVIVHDIKVHPVSTRLQREAGVFAQAGEIGGQDGRGNHQRLFHGKAGRIIEFEPNCTPAVTHYPTPPLDLLHQGKVRDIYAVDDERLLIVASDRLSAFDVILPDAIPGKGEILTRISRFWFSRFDDLVRNHLLDDDLAGVVGSAELAADLGARSMLVRRLEPLPVEAIVRGYLAGSGWKDYQANGSISGIALPEDLQQADSLPGPIFTPSTKAGSGEHDANIDFGTMQSLVGAEIALRVRDISLAVYRRAAAYARNRGIIIADTKFEFGLDAEGHLFLIDEVLTPDSSRFWPVEEWRLGTSPPSFDKQFVRDYLETLDWDKTAPGPKLPPEIIEQTRSRYSEALDRLIEESA